MTADPRRTGAGEHAAAPRYLVANSGEATTVLRRLARAGWRTREGFALPEAGWDVAEQQLVLFGRVPDMDAAALAVLAAARGAGVVVIADDQSDTGRAVLADLSRIGPVLSDPNADPVDEQADQGSGDDLPLSDEQRSLLDRLGAGETIAAAAEAEFLSLRTANRRIAEARKALGVRTTREAVLTYLRAARGDA
ncbi:MAG TPA: LuxR family transcriptional regulator [Actinocatenispora sp.]